jgi:putative flippase GtrA
MAHGLPITDCRLADVSSSLRSPVQPASRPSAWIRSLHERFAHLYRELGKFGVVGAISYVIDVAVFNLCRISLTMHWLPSLVISTAVAASLAFVGNRFWTWRDRERTALHREYALYFGFNVVGLLIGAGMLLLTHDILGRAWPALQTPLADNISGKVIGVGLASAFRFWAYRRYVFRPATSEA